MISFCRFRIEGKVELIMPRITSYNVCYTKLLRNNELLGYRGIDRDITERMEVEREAIKSKDDAEESARQFRQLFENMDQGFALHQMIYDAQGKPYDYKYVLINKAFGKLTGVDSKRNNFV